MGGRRRDELGLVEVAVLAAMGLDQKEIVAALRVSQPTVSKRLTEAKRRGLLSYPQPRPVLQRDEIPPDLLVAAEQSVTGGRLRSEVLEALSTVTEVRTLRDVWIQRSPTRRTDSKSWLARLNAVASGAARRFTELLQYAELVGLTWGYSLRFFLEELERTGAKTPRRSVQVFPTVGSFPYEGSIPLFLESTSLARGLGELLNRRATEDQLSLASIPAFIPKSFEADRDTLVRFFETFPAFKRVFGVPGRHENGEGRGDSLLERADTLVTGMGDMPSREGEGSPSLKARLMLEGAHLDTWAKMAVGDIGGVLLPRKGIPISERRKITEINRRFMGPGLEDLQICAQKGTNSIEKRPGVIVIAHTKAKAEVVLEAVRLGCVSEIVMDDELAEALVDLVESEQ